MRWAAFLSWARIDLCRLHPACPPGTFGESCGQKCHCPGENQACHPALGTCVCAAGYHGSGCRQRECCPASSLAVLRGAAQLVVWGGTGGCVP